VYELAWNEVDLAYANFLTSCVTQWSAATSFKYGGVLSTVASQ